MEVGTYMRLRGAIEAAGGAIRDGQIGLADESLGTAYRTLRKQVREGLPDELHDEFDALFSERPPEIISRGLGQLGLQTAKAQQAKLLLEQMGGWLQGHIDALSAEARMKAEAEAYAQARVREERGFGFRRGPQA